MGRNISYSGKKVSVGIDVHRSFYVICAVCDGELVKRSRISSSGASVVNFLLKYFSGAEVTTCYEAGFSGYWLHRHLESVGIRNVLIHAASVEVRAGNRVKTDKRDSLKLATQLDAGRLECIYIPSKEQESNRLLTRSRGQLVKARTRLRLQIRMKLHQFGLFPQGFSGVLSVRVATELIELVSDRNLEFVLRRLLSQWKHATEEIRKIEKALLLQGAGDELDAVYRSVPGVGALSARILSNELGDMSQFKNERQLFSYTGLTPCESSSGETVRRGRISKQGNSYLRHVLVEIAWRAVRKDAQLQKDYELLASRRGKKRAVVAIARKLVGRIRAVLRNGTTYEIAKIVA